MQNLISPSETCSWINIFVDPGTTFQSDLRDNFTVYVKFRLTTKPWFYISVIRDKLWIGLGLHFQTGMLFHDQQNMLTQERV